MEDTAKYTSILRVWYLNTILLGIFAQHTVCCPSGSTRQHLEVLFLVWVGETQTIHFLLYEERNFSLLLEKQHFLQKDLGFGVQA